MSDAGEQFEREVHGSPAVPEGGPTKELREALNDAYAAFHALPSEQTVSHKDTRLAVLAIVTIATKALRPLAGVAPAGMAGGEPDLNHPAPAPAVPEGGERWTIVGAWYGDDDGVRVPSAWVRGLAPEDGEEITVVPEARAKQAEERAERAGREVAQRNVWLEDTERQLAELRWALVQIMDCSGTSTKQYQIARTALARLSDTEGEG
jgi:hypothetical protein